MRDRGPRTTINTFPGTLGKKVVYCGGIGEELLVFVVVAFVVLIREGGWIVNPCYAVRVQIGKQGGFKD